MHELFSYITHIDASLISLIGNYGAWVYIFLFLIIFSETGLVVTPFLPGDSLLFAAGSISAYEHTLDIKLLFILLFIAAVTGNKVNYFIGKTIGTRVFSMKKSSTNRFKNKILNPNHLLNAHHFYERHGGKTIILSRFIPIIRTFIPFVAGAAKMSVTTFTFYNIISGLLWVGSLLAAGYYFGRLPFIQQHLSFVIYSIVFISLLPPIIGLVYRHFLAKNART